jgi:hypothetical protein
MGNMTGTVLGFLTGQMLGQLMGLSLEDLSTKMLKFHRVHSLLCRMI